MWSILNGTIINAITVAIGSAIGIVLAARIPDRYQKIILTCLGLVTILLGVEASVVGLGEAVREHGVNASGERIGTYGARIAMVVVGSLIVGAIIGTVLRLQDRLEGLGDLIHRRLAGAGGAPAPGGRRFAEGFLSASVIFCVGPLTLLGCLKNGVDGDPSYLYIKSFLDGFCSLALAASLGWGVAASVVTVLTFQGGLAISAHFLATGLPGLSLDLMNVVGGLVLLGTAMMILEIKRIPVADLLPGIFLPPLAVWLVETVSPGTLIAAS